MQVSVHAHACAREFTGILAVTPEVASQLCWWCVAVAAHAVPVAAHGARRPARRASCEALLVGTSASSLRAGIHRGGTGHLLEIFQEKPCATPRIVVETVLTVLLLTVLVRAFNTC